MGISDELQGTVKRQLVLFFLIDTSGSMANDKITTVNTAMREVIAELQKLADEEDNADSDIEMAVLEFNNNATWKTPKPVPVKTYVWNDLGADGSTDLGEACRKLAAEMQKDKFLHDHGLYAPVLILMSDGMPNQGYERGFEELKKNSFFANKDSKGNVKEKSIRVACAIGNDADKNMLAEFTGNPELVFEAHTVTTLKNWIKFVAVQTTIESLHEGGQKNMAEKMKEFKEEQEEIQVFDASDF
jgi:uncharacterized protein YegL